MRAYQAARDAGDEPFHRYRRPQDAKPTKDRPAKGKTSCPAQPEQINKETGLLKRLKVLSGCWTSEDEKYFEKLQQPEKEISRALTPEQQALWVDISRCQERWNLVHWYSILAFHSCAGPNELRGLRLGDVNMPQQLINVPWPSSKNKYRHRSIAIEDSAALWALDRLLARAYDLGARQPDHYLFPFRTPRFVWVPGKGASGSFLKRAWEEVKTASKITWFRLYDTRHTAATRLAERGVPVDVIMARMGHASDLMRRHYTHVSMQAQRRWLQPQPYTQHMYAPPPAQWPQQPMQQPQQPQPQQQYRPELPEYLRYMQG
jgi:integrase